MRAQKRDHHQQEAEQHGPLRGTLRPRAIVAGDSAAPLGSPRRAVAVDDLPAVIEFDAGSMVLVAFGRIRAGTARGDQALADRFLNLFHWI